MFTVLLHFVLRYRTMRPEAARDALLASDWYAQRLRTKQQRGVRLWERHVAALEQFLAKPSHQDVAAQLDVAGRLRAARETLAKVRRPEYLDLLRGTLGADPLGPIGPAGDAPARRPPVAQESLRPVGARA